MPEDDTKCQFRISPSPERANKVDTCPCPQACTRPTRASYRSNTEQCTSAPVLLPADVMLPVSSSLILIAHASPPPPGKTSQLHLLGEFGRGLDLSEAPWIADMND